MPYPLNQGCPEFAFASGSKVWKNTQTKNLSAIPVFSTSGRIVDADGELWLRTTQ